MAKLRELQLLRHAKSNHKQPVPSDKERTISDKGKKSASKMRHWLQEQQLLPDYVLVSSATRAQQTFKRLFPEQTIPFQTLDELYLATAEGMLTLLRQVPSNYHRVMLIGHNPGLVNFSDALNEQPIEQISLFPTCALAHYVLPSQWSELNWAEGKLINFVNPKALHKKPFNLA